MFVPRVGEECEIFINDFKKKKMKEPDVIWIVNVQAMSDFQSNEEVCP